MLHATNAPPEYEPFKRADFIPPKKGDVSDTCGASHGCSITRLIDKADEEVCERAQRQAERVPGRLAEGAFIAKAVDVRAIRAPGTSDQAVFVYDDPNADDRGHAVLRASTAISKAAFDEVRILLHGAFSTRLNRECERSPR